MSVIDGDGNIYETLFMGNYEITVKSIRTTKYADGSPIPHLNTTYAWTGGDSKGYVFQNNTTNPQDQEMYGALYKWETVSIYNEKKIAPDNWRVFTVLDCNNILDYLISNGYNWDNTYEGNKVAKSLAHDLGMWVNSTVPGNIGFDQSSNNSSGLGAVPSGFRNPNGVFGGLGSMMLMWLSDDFQRIGLYYDSESLATPAGRNKENGYSIRFLRDAYNIFFDSNGGSPLNSIKVGNGDFIEYPNTPTKNGYVFTGWYKDEELNNLWNFNSDVVNSHTTLYAKWVKEVYKVHFVSNGGTKIPEQDIEFEGKVVEPEKPIKKRFAFYD